jgi:hypothetical protein
MNPTLKKFLPHIIAYIILMVLTFIRFAPIVFENKTLLQSDNLQAGGMQAESRKIQDKTGEYPLWTNSAFAGMPVYQILYPTSNLMKYVNKTFLLGNDMAPPHTGILLMMAGMYLLLIVLGVDWRIGIVGAIGFGFAANHFALAEAGHSTKIVTMAYMAPTLAGILLTFRGKYWLGGGLTALFTALQLYANHVQITYYFFLSLLIFGVVFLIDAVQKGTLKNFLLATGISAAAVLLAAGTNAGRLLTTQEYAEETIRGKSELVQKTGSSGSNATEGGGLSKEYAFADWSYGVLETYNILIPNFMGGSSSKGFANDPSSRTLSALRQLNNNDQATQLAQQATHYWGAQRFTSGPFYMGAAFFFLFFLGAFLVKHPLKWYIIAAIPITFMIAWGDHFKVFNYFMFDYFPMYNKFRDVKMVLGLANMLVVLLGALGLQAYFDKNTDKQVRNRALYFAGGITAGLVLLGYLLSFTLDITKAGENFPPTVAAAVAEDRAGLLRDDALRSLLFVLLSFALLWFWAKKPFHAMWAVLAVGLVAVADIWFIGVRNLSKDDYVDRSYKQQITAPTAADEQIMKDTDPHYRVADFRRGLPFSNALTGYHHQSMGGYHAAKLMRYQEMVEQYLSQPNDNRHIYSLFNTKYFIMQNDAVVPNPDALGNAWFVKEYEIVPDADAEIAALAKLKPGDKAIIQQKYAGDLQGFQLQYDSTASIKLSSYHPDEMVYTYSAKTDQLAVFSEMYYPPSKGWELYLDGQKTTDFTKADFTLRAAKLPAGQHELKMVFAPTSYKTGERISLVVSLLVVLLAAWGVYWFSKKYDWPEPARLPETESRIKQVVQKTEAKRKKK